MEIFKVVKVLLLLLLLAVMNGAYEIDGATQFNTVSPMVVNGLKDIINYRLKQTFFTPVAIHECNITRSLISWIAIMYFFVSL